MLPHSRRAVPFVLALTALVALPAMNLPLPTDALAPVPGPVPLIKLEQVASGFTAPLLVTHAGDASGRVFVVQQSGQVYQVHNNLRSLYLDVSNKIVFACEQGLLGIAFHPDFANNGWLFVSYTRSGDGASVLARYTVPNPATGVPDPTTAQVLLVQSQPFCNHNGGGIAFSPVDGYLYWAIGDGGSGGDPFNNAQNPTNLLGKMLRLDVNAPGGIGIPPTNPYAHVPGYRPEIWAFGLRNPWRWSFDRITGDLWIGDVGQNAYEEVDYQPAAWAGGANYLWRCYEGLHSYTSCGTPALGVPTLPVVEYDHTNGCSIIGGYVYRGLAIPQLTGAGVFLYGDLCSGRIWGAFGAGPARVGVQLLSSGLSITSFGEDDAGEVYVVNYGGTVAKVVAA